MLQLNDGNIVDSFWGDFFRLLYLEEYLTSVESHEKSPFPDSLIGILVIMPIFECKYRPFSA